MHVALHQGSRNAGISTRRNRPSIGFQFQSRRTDRTSKECLLQESLHRPSHGQSVTLGGNDTQRGADSACEDRQCLAVITELARIWLFDSVKMDIQVHYYNSVTSCRDLNFSYVAGMSTNKRTACSVPKAQHGSTALDIHALSQLVIPLTHAELCLTACVACVGPNLFSLVLLYDNL